MKEYKVTFPIRLDQVVWDEYKTLAVFNAVLEANRHLLDRYILKSGDIVKLPEFEQNIKETKEINPWAIQSI